MSPIADTELSALTEDTAPAVDDWFYKVNNAGTVDRKVKYENIPALVKAGHSELGASAASFDFQSIPATGQHLKLMLLLRSDAALTADSVNLILNNDTTNANYDRQRFQGSAATVSAQEQLAATNARIVGVCAGASSPASHFSTLKIDIFNYAKTNCFKVALVLNCHWGARTTGTLVVTETTLGWASTAAINRITITPFTGPNFVSGSSASLYIVKAG